MLRSFKKIGIVCLGSIVWAALTVSPLMAQSVTVLRQGLTYNIGLPESLHDKESPLLGLASGVNTYRVVGFGGDTWYRLQRVYRHPKGGWYAPQGAKQVWVNISYAYAIDEVLR